MRIDRTSAAVKELARQTDEAILDEMDELVIKAAGGDARAVGAIAIAFGAMLLDVARQELGEDCEQEAGDVVQEFCEGMMGGRYVVPRRRGGAVAWMPRVVRGIARRSVGSRG
jgi:DNA-directed RNA polymerase specialized sigma24 family protein